MESIGWPCVSSGIRIGLVPLVVLFVILLQWRKRSISLIRVIGYGLGLWTAHFVVAIVVTIAAIASWHFKLQLWGSYIT